MYEVQLENNLPQHNSYEELLETLKRKEDKIRPTIKTRILEITKLLKEGAITTHAPFQVDMKNNAIQHASTIVGDEVNIQATGVLPGGNRDTYTITAYNTLKFIYENLHIKECQELAEKFPVDRDYNKENRLKTLREICKRPTITIIYSATNYSIRNYIKEALKAADIKLS
jgi:DNA-directed RNA polymerase